MLEREPEVGDRPGLPAIAGVFGRYANLTWGGGSATTSVIHEQIVLKRNCSSTLLSPSLD